MAKDSNGNTQSSDLLAVDTSHMATVIEGGVTRAKAYIEGDTQRQYLDLQADIVRGGKSHYKPLTELASDRAAIADKVDDIVRNKLTKNQAYPYKVEWHSPEIADRIDNAVATYEVLALSKRTPHSQVNEEVLSSIKEHIKDQGVETFGPVDPKFLVRGNIATSSHIQYQLHNAPAASVEHFKDINQLTADVLSVQIAKENLARQYQDPQR